MVEEVTGTAYALYALQSVHISSIHITEECSTIIAVELPNNTPSSVVSEGVFLPPTTSPNAPVPCAIYTRVSTEEQAKEEHYSLDAQEEYCMGEIRKRQHLGWYHKITLSDPGYTGFTFERPGLIKLVALAKTGQIKAVIVYKRERLFRNADLAAQIQAILDSNGVTIVSHVEGVSDKAPHSVLLRQFLDGLAQFERANGRLRVKDCLRIAAKRGDWKGGSPPFGYSYEPGSKVLEVNPEESEIVRVIFERISEGTRVSDLVAELRRKGVRARRSKKTRDSNGVARTVFFCGERIRDMIRYPIYRGVVRVRRDNDETANARKKDVEWDEFRGRHAPIVSEELWFRANRALDAESPSKTHEVRVRKNVGVGLLQGILRCSSCNAAMSAGSTGRKRKSGEPHRYYRCNHLVKGAKESGCTTRQVSCDALETALLTLMGNLEANPASFARSGLEAGNRQRQELVLQLKAELERIEVDISVHEREIEKLFEFVRKPGSDSLTPEAIAAAEKAKEQVRRLETRRIDLEANLNELCARTPSISELSVAFGAAFRALTLADFKTKAEILRSVLREVRLTRVTLGERGSRQFLKRTFRMVARFRTNELLAFGEASPDRIGIRPKYSDVELRTTFEIVSNKKRQQVTLLEHSYTVVSSSFGALKNDSRTEFSSVTNPIQRAIRWKAIVSTGEKTAAQIADEERISKGLISQHFALLELPALIVDFLREGRDAVMKRKFSLRELQRLATMPFSEAVARFHARVAGTPIQQVLPLKP